MPSAGDVSTTVQPDQRPDRWDDHVSVYEEVFEPFSLRFAEAAIDALALRPGMTALDVGAGSGGAALEMAGRGARVTAVDASPAMCERIRTRAEERSLAIAAVARDGQALAFPSAAFDAALSVFGVILFPDAVAGLAEMRRVVRPGGRVAVVTWTEPQAYELAGALRAAIEGCGLSPPSAALPAQLRYRERADFEALFGAAGFAGVEVSVLTAHLVAPSGRWIADRIAFAPGMAAQLDGLGDDRHRVVERLAADLEARFRGGAVRLAGKAFVGAATAP